MNFFLLSLFYVAFKSSKHVITRPISFGILWFIITLLPTSSVIPLAEILNDHRMFFPYIGLVLAMVYGGYLLIMEILMGQLFYLYLTIQIVGQLCLQKDIKLIVKL